MTNTTDFLDDVKSTVKTFTLTRSTYLAAGNGTTTEAVTDTTLETEAYRDTRQEYSEGTSDVVVSLFMPSTSGDDSDITEVGCLDAAAAGNLMMHKVFPAVEWTTSVDIWIDVEEQVDVTQ